MTGCHPYPANLTSFQGHAGRFGLHCRLHSWPKGGGGQALLMSFHQGSHCNQHDRVCKDVRNMGSSVFSILHKSLQTKIPRGVYLSRIVRVYWRFFHNTEQYNLAMSAVFGPVHFTQAFAPRHCPCAALAASILLAVGPQGPCRAHGSSELQLRWLQCGSSGSNFKVFKSHLDMLC